MGAEQGLAGWRGILGILGPDLERFAQARQAARGGPKILLATGVGGHHPVAVVDSLLAVALTLAGAEVHFLLCDAALAACEHLTCGATPDLEAFARQGVDRGVCAACFEPCRELYQGLGLTLHRYSDWLGPEDVALAGELARSTPLEAVPGLRLRGQKAGEHALAGALRFFARGELEPGPVSEGVLRRYLQGAAAASLAVGNLLRAHSFVRAGFHHGIYVPQGLVGEACRAAGVGVANWQVAYRKRTFIFSHGDTYHHTLIDEPVELWRGMDFGLAQRRQIQDYLASRASGANDWIWFHKHALEDQRAVLAELGLDPEKPMVLALTNVIWDAQLHYPANAFASMTDWMVETVRHFARRPDLQLVIRVHPAEATGSIPSRQRMADELAAAMPGLPGNVLLVGPESPVSTYALARLANAAIIYGTKTGIELTCGGVPTIVAGEAWIRGKGLTRDVATRAEYARALDALPCAGPLAPEVVEQALRYAFHFFFRRMIPLAAILPCPGWPPYRVDIAGLDALAPGQDPGLDVIVRGLMHGEPFIYPAERPEQLKQKDRQDRGAA